MNNSSLLTANLGLPETTRVKRPLPKAQLYKRFDWTASQREHFDAEVSRLDFVNWISTQTVPAIAEGVEVKEIFVVEVSLKSRDFDQKSIVLLAKSIPQRIIYVLRDNDEVRIAVYHTKLFITDRQFLTPDSSFLILQGLNLDAVWENVVRHIGNITPVGTSLRDVSPAASSQDDNIQHAKGMSLQEQIKADEERAKLERQIAALERQMNAAKQPRRKRELFIELQTLKKQ